MASIHCVIQLFCWVLVSWHQNSILVKAASLADQLVLEYKCCNSSSVTGDAFHSAENVHSLDECRSFCRTHRYGEPVYRLGSWACADITHTCSEVSQRYCRDELSAENGGYYRYYALQSFALRRRTERGERIRSGISDITVVDRDSGQISTSVRGGSRKTSSDTTSKTDTDIQSSLSERFDKTSTLAGTRSFTGVLPGGSSSAVSLGENGAALVEESSRNTVSRTDRTDHRQTDTKNSDVVVIDTSSDHRRQRLAARSNGLQQTDSDSRSLTLTRRQRVENTAQVEGTARATGHISLASLSTSLPKDSDIRSNVRITKTAEKTNVDQQAVGRERVVSRDDRSGVKFVETHHGAELEERNDRINRVAVTNEESKQQSEKVRNESELEKKELGTISQANSQTKGTATGRKNVLVTTEAETSTSKSKHCHNCESNSSDFVKSQSLQDDLIDTSKTFRVNEVESKSSVKHGPTVEVRGKNEISSEVSRLDRLEKGTSASHSQASGTFNCKEGSDGRSCGTGFTRRKSSVTTSSNSTNEDTIIDVEESNVSGATF